MEKHFNTLCKVFQTEDFKSHQSEMHNHMLGDSVVMVMMYPLYEESVLSNYNITLRRCASSL